MSFVHPHPAFRVHESPERVVVELPAPRRPVTAIVLSTWLVGWAVGLAFTAQQFQLGGPPGPDRGFLAVWAVAWLLAGLFVAAWLAWILVGHERVALTGEALEIRDVVLAWGRTRAYPLADVHGLRTFGRELAPLLAAGLDLSGQGASGVQFQHGEQVVRFARSLDESTAHALVDLLRAHHAFVDRPQEPPVEPAA